MKRSSEKKLLILPFVLIFAAGSWACSAGGGSPQATETPIPSANSTGEQTPSALESETPETAVTLTAQSNETPEETPSTTIDFSDPPAIFLQQITSEVEGHVERLCLISSSNNGDSHETCTDLPALSFDSFTQLPTDFPIFLILEEPRPNQIELCMEDEGVDSCVHSIKLSSREGRSISEEVFWERAIIYGGDHILRVTSTWNDQGSVEYLFAISIPPDQLNPLVPALYLGLGQDTEVKASIYSACWRSYCGDGIPVVDETHILTEMPMLLRFDPNTPVPIQIRLQLYDGLVLEENIVAAEEFVLQELAFTWEPDVTAGQYAFTVFVEWDEPEGDAAYLFGVELP